MSRDSESHAHAPVAQLDRAQAYEAWGSLFDSGRARRKSLDGPDALPWGIEMFQWHRETPTGVGETQAARPSSPASSFLGGLVVAVSLAFLVVYSLLGVAAPAAPGEGGARLASYASVGRQLARGEATEGRPD